jgi:putative DNA primase/helicase
MPAGKPTMTAETIAKALGGSKAGGGWTARCPAHDDRDPSLSIHDSGDGKVLVRCHAGCEQKRVIDALRNRGLWANSHRGHGKISAFEPNNGSGKAWTIISEHIYRDEHGKPYLRVRKCLDEKGRKQYPQSKWNGNEWVSGKPAGAKIPYQLPQLLAAPATATIYIVEGEKCCDALTRLGFVSTCNSEGADDGNGKKWTPELNNWFKGRNVVLIPDNDAPGRKHVQHVAKNLHGVAQTVRVLDLAPNWPGEVMPVGDDVADWIEQHDRAGSRLAQLAGEAPLWDPTTARSTTRGGSTTGDEVLIRELAALSRLDYAKRRAETAEQIGIGVTELDKIVAEARGESSPATPERWAVEPWPEAVATADLLQALQEIYRKHVVLPEHGAMAMALWCLHAWTIDAAYVSPFLMLTSPEMRCGKSTVLSLLYRTGPRTTFAANISSASVFRYIEACHPTLLIDEADTFARDDETLRGILNSGHTRDTAFVIRCEGDDNTPKEFSTWAPKAIASIGKLAATLRDRAIILPMRRKKPGERVAKLRAQDGEPFISLRRKAARWAGDNLEALKAARPELPEELNDRAQDNWEPLSATVGMPNGRVPPSAFGISTRRTGGGK